MNATCLNNFNSTKFKTFFDRVYILDFAGGGAVHLLGVSKKVILAIHSYLLLCALTGGVAGLILAIFAKIQKRSDHKVYTREGSKSHPSLQLNIY